ncbi:hypothetical protein MC885_004471, partial [Smutsia gigantea]
MAWGPAVCHQVPPAQRALRGCAPYVGPQDRLQATASPCPSAEPPTLHISPKGQEARGSAQATCDSQGPQPPSPALRMPGRLEEGGSRDELPGRGAGGERAAGEDGNGEAHTGPLPATLHTGLYTRLAHIPASTRNPRSLPGHTVRAVLLVALPAADTPLAPALTAAQPPPGPCPALPPQGKGATGTGGCRTRVNRRPLGGAGGRLGVMHQPCSRGE